MTLPNHIVNSILAHNVSAHELTAPQNESATIPQWLKIFEEDPTKLAMFAATQLRWKPCFIEGAEDSEKIYSGEITSLTFNGRGVITDQALVKALTVLVQACQMPFEKSLGKPSNIELATDKTLRAVIRYSDEVFIEFKIGKNSTITAQAQGISSFNFPQQEILKQIKEYGSRFMSSTGLVLNAKSFEESKVKKSVLIQDDLFDAIMKAVQDTIEHSQEEKDKTEPENIVEEDPTDILFQFSNEFKTASGCINPHLKPRYDSSLHSSTANISCKEEARINCSPYLLGKMINTVYRSRETDSLAACIG